MGRLTRGWWALFVVIGLATIVTLSARGRDDDKHLAGTYGCDTVNEDPSIPRWSVANCIEGHECVECNQVSLGDLITPEGSTTRLSGPYPVPCGGDRVVGVCSGNGSGPEYCDMSNYFVDGQCEGAVNQYMAQAE